MEMETWWFDLKYSMRQHAPLVSQFLNIASVALVIWLAVELGQQIFEPQKYEFEAYDSRIVHVTQRRWFYPDKTWTMHARFNQELKAWTWQIEYSKSQWCEAFTEHDDRPEE